MCSPLLFLSSYLRKRVLATSSWDYTSRTLSTRLYNLYLFFFLNIFKHTRFRFDVLLCGHFFKILRSSKEITRLLMTSEGTTCFSKLNVSFNKIRRQTDVRMASIVLLLKFFVSRPGRCTRPSVSSANFF